MHGRIFNVKEENTEGFRFHSDDVFEHFDSADYVVEVKSRKDYIKDITYILKDWPYTLGISPEGYILNLTKETLMGLKETYTTDALEDPFVIMDSPCPMSLRKWLSFEIQKHKDDDIISFCIKQVFDFHY